MPPLATPLLIFRSNQFVDKASIKDLLSHMVNPLQSSGLYVFCSTAALRVI